MTDRTPFTLSGYAKSREAKRTEAPALSEHQLLLRMQAHGGDFLSALATAWLLADAQNAAKLREDFSHYLTRFVDAPAVQS